ncbi:MAG TPA: phosphodiesterase, partial [Myxococcales bacterium]|nr:phosphodiesterase [Myxococcales bacterium]
MRLFKTILLLMLVASIVPTLMVGALSVSDTREMLIRNAQELAQERVRQLSLRSEGQLSDSGRAVTGLARVYNLFHLPLKEQQKQIQNLLVDRREVSVLTAFDAQGKRIPGLQAFDIPPSEVATHQERAQALLQQHLTELRFSAPYQSPSKGCAVVTLVFPLGSPVEGYIAAEVAL